MKIVKPSIEYRDTFIDGLKEYQLEGGFPTVDAEERRENFLKYIGRLHLEFKEGHGDTEKIHMEHLWLIDRKKYIGTALLRHQLNDNLLNIGGNITYEIRPSERRKGYGKKILELTLLEAKKRGMVRVLVTCDKDNIASRKIIEANGGIQDTSFFEKGMRIKKLRYWIHLN
ncbi:MAG: putative acetyltransferase [Saprospiraceae bacterium]|jgi:predicted acetyltransferase